MLSETRKIISPIIVSTIMIGLVAPSFGAPSGKSGISHRFPHKKTKAYQELRNRDVKAEEITHLYGNHICPVMDDTVVPESYVDYRDAEHNTFARIYLCCDGCQEKTIESFPDLYYKLYRTDKDSGKVVEARDLQNKTCPVMEGEPASPHVAIEYNGMIIHFHHSECVEAFLADPEPGMRRLLPDAKEFEYERPKHAHN